MLCIYYYRQQTLVAMILSKFHLRGLALALDQVLVYIYMYVCMYVCVYIYISFIAVTMNSRD